MEAHFPLLNHMKPSTSPEVQASAVQNLITRLIPEKASWFIVKVNPNLNNDGDSKDVFHVEKKNDGHIHITATTGVAAAAGFNHYLKYFCNGHVSWEASQLHLPEELPNVNITINFNDKFRYYQNVCTTSYSFVWWNWSQWEKHIDWMALNAFNLVLAFNGQEAIWERVYQKFNMTSEDIDEQFSGPAFLSWLRMGNLKGWAGPLSKAWHNRSLILQKQILQRMRELGIIPILPAFAGHLPRAFKRLYPDAKMTKLGSWMGFNDTYCCPYFLEPTEKLFKEIGTAFIKEQIAEFGTDHFYNCDTFNELKPSSNNLTYLSNLSKAIYNAMANADPDAVWIMQNWMFVNDADRWWSKEGVKSFLTAVPIGKMIVLDLMSEHEPYYKQSDQYFGQPYIWCMLHNFGGTLGMFGSSSVINTEPFRARNMANSTMIGTGLTPEGINQNYVIYELMTETAWRNTSTNLSEWIEDYTIRRYGLSDERVKSAWRTLQKTIYDYNKSDRIMGQYPFVNYPSFKWTTSSWYTIDDLFNALSNLIQASDVLRNSSAYLHDLVDVTRQVLQNLTDITYNELHKSFKNNDTQTFKKNKDIFLDIFSDLETLLASNEAFLLGPWINSAKKAANSSQEEKQFEYNARNQITLWGPKGEIIDYANKQWAGLMSNYYAPRWTMFLNYTLDTMINGKHFDQDYISSKIKSEVEIPFTFDRTIFPEKPIGDTIKIVHSIYDKWVPKLKETVEVILVEN